MSQKNHLLTSLEKPTIYCLPIAAGIRNLNAHVGIFLTEEIPLSLKSNNLKVKINKLSKKTAILYHQIPKNPLEKVHPWTTLID